MAWSPDGNTLLMNYYKHGISFIDVRQNKVGGTSLAQRFVFLKGVLIDCMHECVFDVLIVRHSQASLHAIACLMYSMLQLYADTRQWYHVICFLEPALAFHCRSSMCKWHCESLKPTCRPPLCRPQVVRKKTFDCFINEVTWLPSSKYALLATDDGTVEVLDYSQDAQSVTSIKAHTSSCNCVAVSSDER